MTTSLSVTPNLEQIKKQAKELLRALRAFSPNAVQRFHQAHPELIGRPIEHIAILPLQLADAQLVVAREYGFSSWPKLKEEVDRRTTNTGTTLEIATTPLRQENGRVWLEGVRNLKLGHHSQTTFCGALESALAVTDHPYSRTDLMGLSGLAFRTRWYQGNTTPDCCPSSPVGEFPEEIASVSSATGWPIWSGYPLGDKAKSMEYYWDEIVASINDGRPVLAYVLQSDVGIIHGYKEEDNSILGWAYDHGQNDDPIEMPLAKVGEWIAFLDKHEDSPPIADAFVESLRIAVRNFHRDSYDTGQQRGDYRHGERALRGWGNDLVNADLQMGEYYERLFFVNWWTLSSLHDARKEAVDYLRLHADLLSEPKRDAILAAANIYAEELTLTGRTYTHGDVFQAPWTGKGIADWTPDVKSHERGLLAQCADLEKKAIEILDLAIG